MRRPTLFRPLLALACLVVFGAHGIAGAAESLSGPLPAQVVGVVDGDTLAVRVRIWLDQVVETRVRLVGIDTPESRSTCPREKEMAQAARAALAQLVAQGMETVILRDVAHDKYAGRVRARVQLPDGTDLSNAMVTAGHARPYGGGKRRPWCAVAENR